MERIYDVIKNLHPSIGEFLLKNQASGEDPVKTAYEIFKLKKDISRGMLISIVKECMKRRSSRLKTFLSYLHMEPEEVDTVQPQNSELLNITYKPRRLDEYDDKS